uniref:Polynucleotide 5'-hydroxyl-kinase NOL9 n=1 Tax=Strongyloides papillosus TaxID=174720 RepID=A0A0N5CF91_STREA
MSETKDNIIFSKDKKSAILSIQKNHHIAIKGYTNVACLYGEVFIHGFYINSKNSSPHKTYPIASYSSSLLNTVIVNRGNQIEEEDINNIKQSLLPEFPDINENLSGYTKFTAIVYLVNAPEPTIKLMRHFFPELLSNFRQIKGTEIFNHVYLLDNECHAPTSVLYDLSTEKTILQQIEKEECKDEPFTIISIGSKNSGKSTINRFMANAFISQNQYTVLWLDLDIGQPEFTVSGFMSLIELKEPIFTPPPFHMKIDEGNILFVGKYEMDSLHRRYITILQDLVRKIQSTYFGKEKKCVLIVNTMGYIKDKGKDLLDEIIGILSPKLFVMCTDNNQFEYNNGNMNNRNTVRVYNKLDETVYKNPYVVKRSKMIDNGRDARKMRVIGYFSNIFKTFSFVPYSTNPARWPVYVVKMKNYFIFNEPDLPLFEECRLKESLEVTMVALCNFTDNNEKGFNKVPFGDSDLPTPIVICFKGLTMKLNYRLTNLDSFGVGIITHVDMINKTFSICTPLKRDVFENNVKVLARGRGLQIPPILLNCQVNDNYDGYRSLKTYSKEWVVYNQTTARHHESMIKSKFQRDNGQTKKIRTQEVITISSSEE